MFSLLAATAPPKASPADFNIAGEAAKQGVPGAAADLYNNADRGFGVFLSGVLSMAMVFAALLVLLYLMWGAIEWISAGGDKAKVEKGRNRMTQAVIGIIVLASTLALFTVLQQFLGITVVNFGALTGGLTGKSATTINKTIQNTGGSGGLLNGLGGSAAGGNKR